MKIPPIQAYKTLDGRYRFYLPDVDNTKTHKGETYDEDGYVAAFLKRHSAVQDPRCADPRCVNRFVQVRVDQVYCSPKCKNAHSSRKRYQLENGMPDDVPITIPSDVASVLEAELRAAIQLIKAQLEARPAAPLPKLLPDSLRHLRGEREHADAEARRNLERQRAAQYDAFLTTLRAAGHAPDDDFWKDQLLDLFDAYCAAQDQLPADLTPYIKEETQ